MLISVLHLPLVYYNHNKACHWGIRGLDTAASYFEIENLLHTKVLKYQDIHKVFAGLIERVSLCDNFCFPIVDDNVVK